MPYNYGGRDAYGGKAGYGAPDGYAGRAAYSPEPADLRAIMPVLPLVRNFSPVDVRMVMDRMLNVQHDYKPKEAEPYKQGFDENAHTEESINYRFLKSFNYGTRTGDVNNTYVAEPDQKMPYADTLAAPAYAVASLS